MIPSSQILQSHVNRLLRNAISKFKLQPEDEEMEGRKKKRRRTYHLYLKKNPSMGANSGTSSVVRDVSGRCNNTYGVSSQPTMGMSDGRCTRSTLSMLLSPAIRHQSPHALDLTLTLTKIQRYDWIQNKCGNQADPPSPDLEIRQCWSIRQIPRNQSLQKGHVNARKNHRKP